MLYQLSYFRIKFKNVLLLKRGKNTPNLKISQIFCVFFSFFFT